MTFFGYKKSMQVMNVDILKVTVCSDTILQKDEHPMTDHLQRFPTKPRSEEE